MKYLAHGLGGAKDLPVPASLAIAGAMAALVISFTVLAVAWRKPRYDAATQGRELPGSVDRFVASPWFTGALRVLGLVFAAYLAAAMVFGKDLVINPVFGVFYVLLWVGIVPASLLFGQFYRALSPVRTINLLFARASGGDPGKGVFRYPERLGYWPAALGLFAFVWQELVNLQSTYLVTVRLWLVIYLAVMIVGAALFGDRWLERADPFEVYSSLVARLSLFGRRADGRLVLRSPLANLDGVPAGPGLVGVVAVLFGSTAFDSYKDNVNWVNWSHSLGIDITLVNTVALVVACAVVGVSFAAAAMLSGVDGTRAARPELPALLAHSVVPIIVGYMTAHYLSYFVEQGQQTLIQLSDPLSNGANLLGTANLTPSYWLSLHPSFLAVTKVLAVVTGHVLGVIAAHDRAIKLLPRRHQLTGQLGMLVVMVAYTATGLYLLFGA